MNKSLLWGASLIVLAATSVQALTAQQVDTQIRLLMRSYHIPAASVAIIQNNQVMYAQNFTADDSVKLTAHPLFQAGSVSKVLTAYGALALVKANKLDLKQNINQYLTHWQLADRWAPKNIVSARELLAHTAGTNVAGFEGYLKGQPLPTDLQTLKGEKPANNPAVKVINRPGSRYGYSGGGYQVVQLAVNEIAHESFPQFMADEVFTPLDMTQSFFSANLPESRQKDVVPGFINSEKRVPEGWREYPEYAAAGLWTNASDLAKLIIDINRSYVGQSQAVINQALAQEMLTRVKPSSFGLGVVVAGQTKNLVYAKVGHNEGYYAFIIGWPESGDGAVVMIDTDSKRAINYSRKGRPGFIDQLVFHRIATWYNWPKQNIEIH